jgi:hypothetical protein
VPESKILNPARHGSVTPVDWLVLTMAYKFFMSIIVDIVKLINSIWITSERMMG